MAKVNGEEKKLRTLLKVQKIDSKLDEIAILKGELPMEVQDLEDEVAGLNKRIENIQEDINQSNEKISNYHNTIKEAETLIIKYERQQNQVKNNREFDALTKEIELQQLEMELSDKRINDCTKEIEVKTISLDESKSGIDNREKDLIHKKSELDTIIDENQKAEDSLKQEADKAKGNIEDRILFAYHKIRNTYKNGLAIVAYARDSCGGCFNKIPPQRQLEIRQRTKIIVCEHCGRVLVDPELKPAN